jgi:hypothetical protein
MLSNQSQQTIDALSRNELLVEINKASRSRFQGDNFAYLKTRFALLEKQEQDDHMAQQLSLDVRANQIANEANEIARESNTTSSKAYRISVFSVITALVAILIALLPQCSKP